MDDLVSGAGATSTMLANPCFRVVTASEAISKDSTGNSQLNIQSMKEYNSSAVNLHCGGGTTDNASDAWLETSKTFDGLIKGSTKERIYGVLRRVLLLSDLRHPCFLGGI